MLSSTFSNKTCHCVFSPFIQWHSIQKSLIQRSNILVMIRYEKLWRVNSLLASSCYGFFITLVTVSFPLPSSVHGLQSIIIIICCVSVIFSLPLCSKYYQYTQNTGMWRHKIWSYLFQGLNQIFVVRVAIFFFLHWEMLLNTLIIWGFLFSSSTIS